VPDFADLNAVSDMRISGIDAIAIDIPLSRNFVRPPLTIQRQGRP
jgi:hypothetical protein